MGGGRRRLGNMGPSCGPSYRWLAAVALVGLVGGCAGGGPRERIDLLVVHGTVIDPASEDPATVADVAVDDGVIVAVGEGLEETYEAAQRVDAAGEYLLPGLADMHTHFGTGVRPPDVDDTTVVLARMLYYGVTTTLNLGSFQAWPERIDALRAEMAAGRLAGPRLLAVGALITVPGSHPTTTIYSEPLQEKIAAILAAAPPEGPVDLAPETGRATTLVRSGEEMRAEVRRLGEWGADAIKIVVESGPGPWEERPQMPPELIAAAVEAARPFDLPVLCHVSSHDEAESCMEQGAAGLVHAAPPEGLEERMAAAGVALVPTASLFEGWARYPTDLSLLDAPLLAETLTAAEREELSSDEAVAEFPTGPSQEQRLAALRRHLEAARNAGVRIAAGTDVGNPYRFPGYALHEELAFYVSAGLTPLEALATATVDAALLVGDEGEWGSIREGLSADLLILRANPLDDIRNTREIRSVIRAGRIVDRGRLPVR